MNELAELYMKIGGSGILVVALVIMGLRSNDLAKLAMTRALNGKMKTGPVASCPWSMDLSKEWNSMLKDVKEMRTQHAEQQRQIDKGDFSCMWSTADIRDLTKAMGELAGEIKLLRREFELTRNGHK